MSIALQFFAVALLVFLNGFFVAAEFALVKVRDTQLDGLVRSGNRRARVARLILRNLDASLSACQLGITLASLGLGWIGEPVFKAMLTPVLAMLHITSPHIQEPLSFIFGFTVLTFLHITAGEQAPKWLAIQKPLPTALWVAIPLAWFHKASYPFIWLLNHSALWMLQKVGIEQAPEGELAHSEEELKLMFASTFKENEQSKLGRGIVLNAMDLKRRIVREVMRPRKEVVFMNTTATIPECLELAEKSRYSRFPLTENGNLDQTLGVVHIKDLYAYRSSMRSGKDLIQCCRKLIYVPETARLESLLKLFLDRKLHLAIVVDEYGSTAGMITLENILEELVGQIQDEFDQEQPMITELSKDSWYLDGRLPLHELEEIIGGSLTLEGATTVSGYIISKCGGFPKPNQTLDLGRFEISVNELSGLLVVRALLKRKPEVN